nr:MAG TPA_asm: hypothetical protein [Caudoviricetes sp.]DAL61300.1 MAG TPA_asm: hypothetical protein [Bacteriophage sp.]
MSIHTSTSYSFLQAWHTFSPYTIRCWVLLVRLYSCN